MFTAKQLLVKQSAEAFSGDEEMSLKASLSRITQAEASWRPDPMTPAAEQIVRHVAWAKSWYCQQGFAKPMLNIDPRANDLEQAMALLEQAQRVLVDCLESCPEEALAQPIPTKYHGESAAHFFWIMCMHDIYHAGQIRTRRTMCGKPHAQYANLAGARFANVNLAGAEFDDVNLAGAKFNNVNLSDVTIQRAQVGGARFSWIGPPPDKDGKQARQRAASFENMMLSDSTLRNVDLSNVQIIDCNIRGMTIDGVPLENLLEAH